MLPRRLAISDHVARRGVRAGVSLRRAFRRLLPGVRRAAAAGLAPLVAAGQILVPVAVTATGPAFAGTAGAPLIKEAIGYALAGSGTGLYMSLNCEYSSAAAGTAVPILAGVDGGGFTVTGQGSTCPNSGTVNTAEGQGVS